jgi:hypothetical protein
MMDCGSDFRATGDNDVGAYERIVRQHVDGLAAQSAVGRSHAATAPMRKRTCALGSPNRRSGRFG